MKQRTMRNTLASALLRPQIRLLLLGLFVFFAALISTSFLTANQAHAAVPYQMNFQGRLNDSTGAPMPNGTYNMIFRIYSAATGGSALWTETKAVSASQGVTVTTGGLFSTQLGSVTSLPNNIFNTSSPLYLEVELPTPGTATSSSPSWTEGAMGPRNPISSSPYAINSSLLNGKSDTDFAAATGGSGYIQNQTASAQGASFRINGTGSIQGSSTTTFQVQNAAGGAVLSVDTTTNRTTVAGTLNLSQVSPPSPAPTLAAGAAGSLTGTFYYVISYVTASGETGRGTIVPASITVSAKQVNISNIPVSTSKLVTARKIYRGTSSTGPYYLVATIADNTTTTYTDNVTSLGSVMPAVNSTEAILQNGQAILRTDQWSLNLALGRSTLTQNTTGIQNTALGDSALQYNTTGNGNVAVGTQGLNSNTSGNNNIAVGGWSLYLNTTGSSNTVIGSSSLGSNTTGSSNSVVGSYALGQNTTGSGNTAVGQNSLNYTIAGSNNTAIGNNAGNCDVTNTTFCTGDLQNATAIGAYSQVTQNNSLVLGSVDQGTKVGIGITSPSNLFSVSPLDYQTGTVKRTNGSATLAGTGTTWTSAMVGDIIVFADGSTNAVASFTDATHITMKNTYSGTTDASPVFYRFHKPGFQVTSAGNAYVQNTSTTAFQVQSAAGISVLSVDTANQGVQIGNTPVVPQSWVLSFSANTSYATGRYPNTVVASDFNGDGKPDLAVVNLVDNTVSILLGNGNGTFQPKVDYATGSQPQFVATGDFNGDGKLDLAVANYNSGTVSILLGNGNGTFQPKVDYATSSYTTFVAAGDFNGDSKLDLVTLDQWDGTVSVLLGNGNGTFQSKIDYTTTSTNSTSAATGDFNGDGKLDLAVVNTNDSTVSILPGNGNGTFGTQTDYATGGNPSSVIVRDFNGDGKLDLAVANANDKTISILLGNGNGTFQGRVDYPTGVRSSFITAGDFNGDGKLDLATPAQWDNTVSVLLGNGNGTFGTRADYATGANPMSIATADFNGDGKLDFAVANGQDYTVSIRLNQSIPQVGTSLSIGSKDKTTSALVLQGAAGQVADILHLQDATGNTLFAVGANGDVTAHSSLSVQNAAGGSILSVDTTKNVMNVMGSLNLQQVDAPSAALIATAGAAGSLTGTFYYAVTYVTANGETTAGPSSDNVVLSSKQANLTNIPISSNGLVIGRKIYRGTTPYDSSSFGLVATIMDNTTTTFTDDNDSPGVTFSKLNTTATLQQNGSTVLVTDNSNNLAVGQGALSSGGGSYNTAVGSDSLRFNTTGYSNTAVGGGSLRSNSTGYYNASLGSHSLESNSTGYNNTALGFNTLTSNTTGFGNTAVGYNAGYCEESYYFCTGTTLQNATAIGAYAQVTQNNSLVLGSVDQGTKVGIGITSPSNLFSVSPVNLNSTTISASQTSGSGTITASDAIFSAANVGEILVWMDGTTETITGYTDSTHVTGSSTTITQTGQYFRTHRVGFQVTDSGNAYVQNTSTTAFQVQNAMGSSVLNVDTMHNQTLVMGNLNLVQTAAPTTALTAAAGAAGALTGTYYYVATYVTASGETNYGPASAAVTVSGKQVNLTNIPAGTYGSVTARKIYRGTSASGPFNLVTTINDNTTTTYTDNVTSLGTAARIDNTTASFQQNGISLFRSDAVSYNTAFGLAALFTNTTGVNNTAVGVGSLGSNTTGSSNTSSGIYSLNSNTSGSGNTAMGNSALQLNSTGSGNTGVGQGALQFNTTGSNNTALGIGAGVCDVTNTTFCTGDLQNATAIGAYSQVTQNNSLVLGSVDQGTKVGIGITSPSNLFSVSPLDYQTGTVKRTNGSATLAGTGTTWTSAMVGDIIVFADGSTNAVASFTDATHITMKNTYSGTTDASPVFYRFHKPGFQVTSAGNAYVQNTSTTAFAVQSAAGTSLFTVDTSGMNITIAGASSTSFANLVLANTHFSSTQTTAPTMGVATCTTSANAVTAGSTDSAGSFSLTASSAAKCVVTVTYKVAYSTAPKSVIITPSTAGASAIQAYVSSSTTGSFVVTFNVPATSSTVYKFNYWVVQ